MAVMRSEWTKLRSVRSTYWTLAVAVGLAVGLVALVCANYASGYPDMSARDRAGFDPVSFTLNGLLIAQLAIGTLGVLVMTSEYRTGLIRTTFTATPQRRLVLTAKAAVFGAAALVVGEVLSFSAFLVGQAILNTRDLGASLTDPGVPRAVIGGGLYLAAVGLLGLSLGTLVRHTTGAVAAFFGLLFGTTLVANLMPASWRSHTLKYLPADAGGQILAHHPDHAGLGPWTGYGVLLLYVAAIFAVGYVLVARRDA